MSLIRHSRIKEMETERPSLKLHRPSLYATIYRPRRSNEEWWLEHAIYLLNILEITLTAKGV